MDPSVFRLAVTIIRIQEWISARRTVRALADISSFTDDSAIVDGLPADEALRLEAEEDVDRLLESD